MYPGDDGKLWTYAEDEKGLQVLYFDRVEEQFVNPVDQSYRQYLLAEDRSIRVLHPQSDARLWVGTSKGVIELDLNQHTSRMHNASGALPEDEVIAITSDGPDSVWIITDGMGFAIPQKEAGSLPGGVDGQEELPIALVIEDN